MTYTKKFLTGLFMAAVLLASPAYSASFDSWLQGLKNEARQKGISEATLKSAFTGVQPIQRVIELDRKQPEHKIDLSQYHRNTITPQRVAEGRRLLAENRAVLEKIGSQFGVQPQYVVALWGMETGYGKNTGGFDIIASLSTLAWEGRRGPYFRAELLNALAILDGGHVRREDFKGSWAGAMGQVQFMPTSWKKFAVDYNGDGHKDIWTTRVDAWASAANYLSRNGWVYGQRWGREVKLTSGFNPSLIGKQTRKSLPEWSRLGVRNADGSALSSDANLGMAYIAQPRDQMGRTYIIYKNGSTVMSWNNSVYFATSVGILADKIAEGNSSPIKPALSTSTNPHYN